MVCAFQLNEPLAGEFTGAGTKPTLQGVPTDGLLHEPCAFSRMSETHEFGIPTGHAPPFHEMVLFPPWVKPVVTEGEMVNPLLLAVVPDGCTFTWTEPCTLPPDKVVQVREYCIPVSETTEGSVTSEVPEVFTEPVHEPLLFAVQFVTSLEVHASVIWLPDVAGTLPL
jgi:hypothetical protein